MFSSTKPEVIFTDGHLLVLNKPSGMVVNVSATSSAGTVQNFLEDKYGMRLDTQSEFGQRGGVVHRIDKDTSGILVAVKDESSFNGLKKQFIERKVAKIYLALVFGWVEEEAFEVNAPIKRNPDNRLKMAVVREGREALTAFELMGKFKEEALEFSLLECRPQTGRTHQIRVHLAVLQHPVLGDDIYMTRRQLSLVGQSFPRLMLHAWKISFKHPITGQELNFEAPIPKEFKKFIQNSTKN